MKALTANALRTLFVEFFRSKGHAVIPSASVIPENDPTVLFTTAGMHPLVPYLLGEKHPQGKRLVDVQKCIRTGDIDDVGDAGHLTFFEMLGNWSLGDYFKQEMIPWSWEFLTSPDYLGIAPEKLAFTVFAGDDDCPRDEEAAQLWRACGVPDDRLFYLPKEHNWWGPAGLTGPCGPDSEMFMITKAPCGPGCSPACNCGAYLEIWNDVFMQYNKQKDGSFLPLSQKNVDTGMGLERTICVLNGKDSVYETELFTGILGKIEALCGKKYQPDDASARAFRIVADHLRTAVFIIGDPRGIAPSNVGQGYILRRLIRRAVRYGMGLGLGEGFTACVAEVIINQYSDAYPELEQNRAFVLEQLTLEEGRFARTLLQGEKEFEKLLFNIRRVREALDSVLYGDTLTAAREAAERKVLRPSPDMLPILDALNAGDEAGVRRACQQLKGALSVINGRSAFKLYDTYGFPIEITKELAAENGLTVDEADFARRFEQHQATSRSGAEQIFKGGLADHSEQTACLHTATHLLQAALRQVLGEEVRQKGSNITAERLRFDFTFGRKVTPEELARVEALVNAAIAAKAPVTMTEMTVAQAKALGAIGLFESKYGELVRVYAMGDFSREICGGPHAGNTRDLVSFKITKEEASSAGVRRIKAVIGRKAE